MNDDIKYFQEMISNKKIEGHNDPHYVWTLCCINYYYFNNNLGPKDISKYWTDGGGDGEIDFVYDDNQNNILYLIQGKSENKLNFKDIKKEFKEMSDTIKIFKNNEEEKYNLNKKLKKAYKNGIINKKDSDIVLILFTNTIITKKIAEEIQDFRENFNYKIEVYGRKEIEEKRVQCATGEKCVSSGYLLCNKNYLEYSNGKNSGIIINIKATSLKDLFDRSNKNELFGYNLRDHISDTRLGVDKGIEETIDKDVDNFWFYNNGITIGCSNYKIVGDKLKLSNFSIINGAQTTYVIGNYKKVNPKNDFEIICKVIKSPNSLDDRFIKTISTASNSQKEIQPRDLYANAREQMWLQYNFSNCDYPLAISIKRGVKPSNYNTVKDWERIDNSFLGQIVLATYLQKPGIARNTPSYIFLDKDIYEQLFNLDVVKNYNYDALYDLVRINNYCDKYKKKMTKIKEKEMEKYKTIDKINNIKEEIGIIKNCGFTIISVIYYLIKRMYFNFKGIKNNSDEEWERFYKIRINSHLSLNYKCTEAQYRKIIESIFSIILEHLKKLYVEEKNKPQSKIDNPSNYFKRDDLYRIQIISDFDYLYDNYKDDELFSLLKIFDDESNIKNNK